nr:MAG TPA: hypothetical protein [Caudoviricetes sp.]
MIVLSVCCGLLAGVILGSCGTIAIAYHISHK